jgi:thiamine biosynthesis lipoprotein
VNGRFPTALFEAWGTTAQVTLTTPAPLEDALRIVSDEVRAIDAACSRFRDDSELARVEAAAGSPVRVSPLLLEALDVALHAAAATDGDVDPTVAPSLRGLGWDLDFAAVRERDEPASLTVTPAAGWHVIRLDRTRRTVQVPPGVAIDLGATAKALAADRAARTVHARTGASVLVSLGGDISTAGRGPHDGWPVRVTDDHRNGSSPEGQTIALRGGGLATSSTTVRRWRAGGDDQHHIVDPRTGKPVAEFWRTASVAAPSCVQANTASTAAIVRGPSASEWLDELGLTARLVRTDGTVVLVGSWPEEDA